MLRFVLVSIACVACSSTASSTDAYPSNFTFVGDFAIDPPIDSAMFGSANYVAGQTIHIELTYASYAASQGSSELIVVTASGVTATLSVGPFCDVQPCPNAGAPYHEDIQGTVEWSPGSSGPQIQDQGTCYTTTGVACGWIN